MNDIAVIIPAYQSEGTIDAALGSVAGQTVAPREVVVVDDGSSDRTVERAERWNAMLPLTVIRQCNAGPAAARGRAIEASSAPLLTLLDADDLWLPDHLEILAATHDQRGGIVTAGAVRWFPGRGVGARDHLALHRVPPVDKQLVGIVRQNFVFVGALFAREDFDRAGGFRDGFSGAEDWDLWIRMIRLGTPVTATEVPTVVYRIKDDSLSAGVEIHETYRRVLETAEQEAVDARELSEIRRSLLRYRSRADLGRAHHLVEQGELSSARSIARSVRAGPWWMRLEAIGLAAAPRLAVSIGHVIRRRRWRT